MLVKFLQIIFCYCNYIWAAHLIRGVFHFRYRL